MESLKTEEILLNPILGARLLWPAIYEYQLSNDGISLPLVLLILPIVLHQRSRKFIYKMDKKGGSIGKAINKGGESIIITGNDLALGLQARLNETIPLTLSSLNIGISSGLFLLEPEEHNGFPCYTTPLTKMPSELISTTGSDADEKMKASSRLGSWFANSTVETIYSSLKIAV